MPVSFGVHTGQQNVAMADLRRLWRWIDDSGMDWISVWDHFYEAPPVDGMSPHFEALTCMATIAAETERVRIGCLVFCVPYRNPAYLAKSLMTLDHISNGRIEPGLGAGWHQMEFEGFGYGWPSLKIRFEMLEEGTQIIKGMLSQERTSFEGVHYHAINATNQPMPVQDHVPLWIGGRGERKTLRMAAQYADGWNVPYIGPEEFARLSGVLDVRCGEQGRDPATIDVSFTTLSGGAPADDSFDPEAHLEALDDLANLGVTWCMVPMPSDSLPHAVEALHRYGESVINP